MASSDKAPLAMPNDRVSTVPPLEVPLPLPSAKAIELSLKLTLQPPLSRAGKGPGLIIITPGEIASPEGNLDVPPRQKWAEEGYAVVDIKNPKEDSLQDTIEAALDALNKLDSCDVKGKICVIIYEPSLIDAATDAVSKLEGLAGIVAYCHSLTGKHLAPSHMYQVPGKPVSKTEASETTKIYTYPTAKSPFFVLPNHEDFDYSAAGLAHTRALTFIKALTGGPIFDLEAIWEEHTWFEFGDKSAAKTMATMVQEPYVNHIPTMTGGIGRTKLTDFYTHHFIWSNPDDADLVLVSRTIGIDRVVDEFIYTCTHIKEIDWLIPGIPPTGKKLRVPMMAVVNIRGDRLYHEHISWDQASVLVQLDLMPKYLSFPYKVYGEDPGKGKKFEYRVPAAGVATANKLQDESNYPSNEMFEYKYREVDL